MRLDIGTDFFAHQMNVWGTPRNLTGHPDNATREAPLPVHYEMLDVIIARDGKIHRKDTFVDTLAILAGTSIVENAA